MSDFMKIAFEHAKISQDPSTKVGAVIVEGNRIVGWGHNHIPPQIPFTGEMLNNREWKYPRVIHAEVAAILDWVQTDQAEEASIYVTHHPCEHCASLIIYSGIKHVFTNPVSDEMFKRWPGMAIAEEMFREAKVSVTYLDI